jgi:hypothetical protein
MNARVPSGTVHKWNLPKRAWQGLGKAQIPTVIALIALPATLVSMTTDVLGAGWLGNSDLSPAPPRSTESSPGPTTPTVPVSATASPQDSVVPTATSGSASQTSWAQPEPHPRTSSAVPVIHPRPTSASSAPSLGPGGLCYADPPQINSATDGYISCQNWPMGARVWFTINGNDEIGSVAADKNRGDFKASLDLHKAFRSWPGPGYEFWVNAYDAVGHADRVKFHVDDNGQAS